MPEPVATAVVPARWPVGRALLSPARWILWGALRLYKLVVSPVLAALFGPAGLGCRFTPSCSDYAAQAVIRHGAARGSLLALRRLCRCHPWGDCGCDPVPERCPGVREIFATRPGPGILAGRAGHTHTFSQTSH